MAPSADGLGICPSTEAAIEAAISTVEPWISWCRAFELAPAAARCRRFDFPTHAMQKRMEAEHTYE
jgi:hypothetical protein